MPHLQAMAERGNQLFNRVNIDKIEPEVLAPGTELPAAARELGIAVSDIEVAYLAAWPAGQQEALRATLYSAVTRTPRLPVTFAWAAGYDFELTIWEAGGTPQSLGGTTILLRSRYPADAHPAAL